MVKFWQLSSLQKTSVLVAVSLAVLGLSWLAHFLIQGKTVLEAETSILGCLFFPSMVLSLGVNGNLTCPPDERTPPDYVLVWLMFSSYLLLLSCLFYYEIMPVERNSFIMPLGWGAIMLPFEFWDQNRAKKKHNALDSANSDN